MGGKVKAKIAQQQPQKSEPRKPGLSEGDTQVVAGSGQDRDHRITTATEQVISSHQTVVFRMPDDGFDGVATLQSPVQCPGHAALLYPAICTLRSLIP